MVVIPKQEEIMLCLNLVLCRLLALINANVSVNGSLLHALLQCASTVPAVPACTCQTRTWSTFTQFTESQRRHCTKDERLLKVRSSNMITSRICDCSTGFTEKDLKASAGVLRLHHQLLTGP